MNPVIIIPARMASQRLPGKPLLPVGDAPMIVQVWRRAVEASAGDVVVACDGEEIAAAVAKAGGRAVITDPGLPSGSDRVHAALSRIDPDGHYDVVVNLQGDMPTIAPDTIRAALDVMRDPAVDIATLAAPLKENEEDNPAVVKIVVSRQSLVESMLPTTDYRLKTGRAVSFSRDFPKQGPAYHHIGIYAYRREALEKFVSLPPSALEQKEKLEQLRAMEAGMRIAAALVEEAPVGVDTEETLKEARKLIPA